MVMRSWITRVTVGRLANSWRLFGVVALVAVLAATTVSTLGLLAAATEQAGTRSALAELSPAESNLVVNEHQLGAHLSTARDLTKQAVGTVLGRSASARVTSQAFTTPGDAYLGGISPSGSYVGGAVPDASYLGEMQGVRAHAVLVSGTWPEVGESSTTADIPVAIPQAGATAAHLEVGARFLMEIDYRRDTRTAVVVGIYRAKDPHGAFWAQDPLHGAGNASPYPLPDGLALRGTDGFGPMLVAQGELDATDTPVNSVQFVYTPDFRRMTVDAITPLINNLGTASRSITSHLGAAAQQVELSTSLATPLTGIASSLIVTMSTVVIVALLLLVLAVGALGQTARLFNDSQANERALMTARGASRGEVLALTVVQSVILGILTLTVSPLLARAAFAVLAAQPAMVRAGMPRDSGLPAIVWLYSGAIAALFVIVMVVPQLPRPGTFFEGQQRKSRQGNGSGLLRSGIDLGLVVLAGVLYWQLLIYQSPVSGRASLAIDPVLAAAPVVVLLACTLVSVRLIPAVSGLADRIATRAKGSVLPLAVWEVARRSRQATSAVLLLTLALGVGAFGQSFLATWQQSQIDQANLAVGPALRVPVLATQPARQAVALRMGAAGRPQPVIDRIVAVEDASGNDTAQSAVMLGLGVQARRQLDYGRLAQEGGSQLNENAADTTQLGTGIPLPATTSVVMAVVKIGSPGATVPGVSATITAVLEDTDGLMMRAALGSVPLDGLSHGVRGPLPVGSADTPGLRIVAFEANLSVGDRAGYGSGNAAAKVDVLIGHLAALASPKGDGSGATLAIPLRIDSSGHWHGEPIDGADSLVKVGPPPAGWQLRMDIVVPAMVDSRGGGFLLSGWTPSAVIPAVITRGVARSTGAKVGDSLVFDVSGTGVKVRVSAIAPLIPATAQLPQLSASIAGGADSWAGSAVVVDQAALERALIEAGTLGPLVDEWWVDVPAGHAAAYLAARPVAAAGARSRELLAAQLQADPLRIATQAALWLAIAAAAILAAIGFAAHMAATMRARRLEFAQLRAIGLSRRSLFAVIGVESALLGVIGTGFGVGIGVLLSWLVGPLVAVSPNGSPAIPAVVLDFPGTNVALLVLAVLAALACSVVAAAIAQRAVHPAEILRGADE